MERRLILKTDGSGKQGDSLDAIEKEYAKLVPKKTGMPA